MPEDELLRLIAQVQPDAAKTGRWIQHLQARLNHLEEEEARHNFRAGDAYRNEAAACEPPMAASTVRLIDNESAAYIRPRIRTRSMTMAAAVLGLQQSNSPVPASKRRRRRSVDQTTQPVTMRVAEPSPQPSPPPLPSSPVLSRPSSADLAEIDVAPGTSAGSSKPSSRQTILESIDVEDLGAPSFTAPPRPAVTGRVTRARARMLASREEVSLGEEDKADWDAYLSVDASRLDTIDVDDDHDPDHDGNSEALRGVVSAEVAAAAEQISPVAAARPSSLPPRPLTRARARELAAAAAEGTDLLADRRPYSDDDASRPRRRHSLTRTSTRRPQAMKSVAGDESGDAGQNKHRMLDSPTPSRATTDGRGAPRKQANCSEPRMSVARSDCSRSLRAASGSRERENSSSASRTLSMRSSRTQRSPVVSRVTPPMTRAMVTAEMYYMLGQCMLEPTDSEEEAEEAVTNEEEAISVEDDVDSEETPVTPDHWASPHVLMEIFSYMTQTEIFRAAPACQIFRAAAEIPHIYKCLDVRAVGIRKTSKGRSIMQCAPERFSELERLLKQPRFVETRELDVRGFGFKEMPVRYAIITLVKCVAKSCKKVRKLIFSSGHQVTTTPGSCRLAGWLVKELKRAWPISVLHVEVHGDDGPKEYRVEPQGFPSLD